MRERKKARFGEMDADKNGKVSQAEFVAGGEGAVPGRGHFDEDGKVTPSGIPRPALAVRSELPRSRVGGLGRVSRETYGTQVSSGAPHAQRNRSARLPAISSTPARRERRWCRCSRLVIVLCVALWK